MQHVRYVYYSSIFKQRILIMTQDNAHYLWKFHRNLLMEKLSRHVWLLTHHKYQKG
jgi:hypothetical protein